MKTLLPLAVLLLAALPCPAVVIVVTSPVEALPSIPVAAVAAPVVEHEETSVESELALPVPTEEPADSPAWRKDDDGKLVRLPGPQVAWPYQGCLMCLGIHLERTHKVPQAKLDELGYKQWDVLHCNLHNEAAYVASLAKKDDSPELITPVRPAYTTGPIVPVEKEEAKPVMKKSPCANGQCPSPAASQRWRGMLR